MSLKSLKTKDILCPNCDKPAKKNGSFIRKRSRVKVQRFHCQPCALAFSKQSTNITKRQHRPDLNEKVFHMICNGMGVRRIAQVLNTTPKTVQNKIKFLAVLCEKFHRNHFTNWQVKPRFQFDEMWSVEKGETHTLTVPVVVEKESYFIVSVRSAHTYSKHRYPIVKARSDAKRRDKINMRDLVILQTLDRVNMMKPVGPIIMDTDGETRYPQFLQQVFGSRLVHHRYVSTTEEAIKLFPINNTMACMRAELGKVKRESWYISQNHIWLNAHLAIYTVYYNYFRVKKYTKHEQGLVVVPPNGKAKKQWEHKTPAMKLGIFKGPISFRFLMENYEPKAIPASVDNVVPITHQLLAKKSA